MTGGLSSVAHDFGAVAWPHMAGPLSRGCA